MTPKQAPPPPVSGLSLGDIYYILFRRKWLILGVSLLGFIVAGVMYAMLPIKYWSVAEVYIAYVTDAPTPDTTGPEARPMMSDRGATILNSELNIVQSFDLARTVAETVGPGKILGVATAGTNSADVDKAAIVIKKNLVADVPKMSQIISLSFSHENPDIVKPVLGLLVTNYIIKHSWIHQRTQEFDSYLHTETDLRRMRLKELETRLAAAKGDAGIVDLPEAMRAFTAQEGMIKQENYLAMAEYDEAVARATQLKKMIPPDRTPAAPTNANPANSTNASAPTVTPPTPAEQDAYSKARQRVADLLATEAKLESVYTTNNSQVKTNLIELEVAQAKKKALEEATPGLVVAAVVESRTTASPSAPSAPGTPIGLDPALAYNEEVTKIAGLQARITRQTNELALIKDRGAGLLQLAVTINELERNKAIDEEELKQIERTTEKATMDVELGPDRVTGISVIEQPTPPGREATKQTKIVAGIAGGGVALGLGLAFLLEMVLVRSFKRPQEVASKLGLPFFLSVPYLNGNGKLRLPKPDKAVKMLSADGGGAGNGGGAETARQSLALPGGGAETGGQSSALPSGGAEAARQSLALPEGSPIASWDEQHSMRPFHETLRDRIIAYFEMLNLTHKPKLVAMTSCHHGAGVSTMATGLASVLSETGDGNVLLVNMNSEDGDAHRFYHGKPNMGLDDILEKENREQAQVSENLYVVKETSNRDKLPAILPRRFSHLVSKMKASDYDYIIFDMPPVTQISVTPRLARFMDMVLLVVESQKTDRDVAQRAVSLLSESRANMAVVMNKTRSYVPRMLHQELQ